MHPARRILAAAALVGFGMPIAYAADQTILGDTLQVKNPSTTDKRKVVCKAKEKGSSNTLIGNPTVAGATLTIRVNGGTPSSQTFNLPQGTSPTTAKPFWTAASTIGFKYKDPKYENGPIKGLTIKKTPSGTFQIKATGLGKVASVTVLPPNPGTDGCVLLQISGGDSYSVQFGPLDGTITNKGPLEYKHKRPSGEGTCITTTTSTTAAPTTSTSSTAAPTTTTSSTTAPTTSTSSTAAPTTTTSSTATPTTSTSSTAAPTTTTSSTTAPTTTTTSTAAPTTTTSTTLCSNQVFNFTVGAHDDTSLFDADFDLSDEWLGGSQTQSQSGACAVTVAKPSGNIDLVGTLGNKWTVTGFTGFSNCFGFGGEDGDGCQTPSCDALAAIGFCQDTRPSCSSALGGGGSSGGFQVQCLQ